MIIQPFSVRSRNVDYRLKCLACYDTQAKQDKVNELHAKALDNTQAGARCENRGLTFRNDIDNFVMGIEVNDIFIGIWMIGCVGYTSGPWADSTLSSEINPGADVVLSAVPYTGFDLDPETATDEELEIEGDMGAEVAAELLHPSRRLRTGEGRVLGFDRLHYAYFPLHVDKVSQRTQKQHARANSHARLDVTETVNPNNAAMTLVELRWK